MFGGSWLKLQGEFSDAEGMHKLPSPLSIIWRDHVSWPIITSATFVLGIALAIKLTGTMPGRRGKPDIPVDPEVATLVLVCAVALVLFLSAIVVRRVRRVRNLFDRGSVVEASVRKVAYFRGGRQKLEMEFELYDTPYMVSFCFQRPWKTPAFSEGTRIRVMVDPVNPKLAIPLGLYGDPPPGIPRAGSA